MTVIFPTFWGVRSREEYSMDMELGPRRSLIMFVFNLLEISRKHWVKQKHKLEKFECPFNFVTKFCACKKLFKSQFL